MGFCALQYSNGEKPHTVGLYTALYTQAYGTGRGVYAFYVDQNYYF